MSPEIAGSGLPSSPLLILWEIPPPSTLSIVPVHLAHNHIRLYINIEPTLIDHYITTFKIRYCFKYLCPLLTTSPIQRDNNRSSRVSHHKVDHPAFVSLHQDASQLSLIQPTVGLVQWRTIPFWLRWETSLLRMTKTITRSSITTWNICSICRGFGPPEHCPTLIFPNQPIRDPTLQPKSLPCDRLRGMVRLKAFHLVANKIGQVQAHRLLHLAKGTLWCNIHPMVLQISLGTESIRCHAPHESLKFRYTFHGAQSTPNTLR